MVDRGDGEMGKGDVLTEKFVAACERAGVPILCDHRVEAAVVDDDGAVVGVRAEGPDGLVEMRGPVVLATSTYDWDPELVREFLGLEPEDFGSVAPDSLRGDGIRLARAAGAATATIPATSVPILPGWPAGNGYAYGPEYAMPHAMIVDRSGRRFGNDSYWVDLVPRALDPAGRHLPFFLIMDDQHHRKYGLGATGPGEDYPEGLVTSKPNLEELAGALGIDGEQLQRTVARFNAHAERGEDPDFGRGTVTYVRRFAGDPSHEPSPVLGTLTEAPFHGLRLKFVGTGIGSSGIQIDGDGCVLDAQGGRIPGLYAVGSCAALTTTGSGYNSGVALGRGLTLAYLVARDVSPTNRSIETAGATA
jgi:3-oxosteroid 1-dehydrogenase